MSVKIPAIVAAGDRGAAKAIQGESKVHLRLAGRPLVSHVVSMLQRVPEVSEVWVVGNAPRLEAELGEASLRAELTKPLTIVPQFRNLFENLWETWRRLLPGAPPEGRDPTPEDARSQVLFLSADVPFGTPQEISAFVRQGAATGRHFVTGLASAESIEAFKPARPGGPGIEMAYFVLREGRFRQNNLHLVRPWYLGNRHYIQEMYEHRYQKRLVNAVGLALRILASRGGGLRMAFYFTIIQLSGVADRHGWRRLADWLRRRVSLRRVDRAISSLLDTDFCTLPLALGGCAVDIDNDEDYASAQACWEQWRRVQRERAEKLFGPLPLPAQAGAGGLRVLPEGSPAGGGTT